MTDAKRVAALWALVVAVFGVFNAIYWPIHWRQADLDPANFIRYAEKLRAQGRNADARDVLQKGIAAQHPPFAAPYETLQTWMGEMKDKDAAAALRPTISFYNALTGADDAREKALRDAILDFDNLNRKPRVSEETARAVGWAAKDLAAAIGAPALAPQLKTGEQFALLALAGGSININGAIGDTGVRPGFDLIVQSGGRSSEPRIAHIFLKGRDYGTLERGLHAVLIDPASGQMLQTGIFDIWSDAVEAEHMATMLRDAPTGTIGAFAVLDDASANMTDVLETELRGFGLMPEAVIMRRARFFGLRYSFAAIGVKGSVPGTAMQAWSPDEFAGHRGHPVTCAVFRASGGKKGAQP